MSVITYLSPAPPRSLPPVTIRKRLRWNFADWFILSQTFLPALLYLPGSQPFRVPIRLASYGISLAALAYYWIVMRQRLRLPFRIHPAVPWLIACLVYLSLMILHPTTNSYLAGIAQVGLYVSILAPVFWAPVFVGSAAHFKNLLWLLLFCNGINAFVGVMQVHDPTVWMPKEFSSVITNSQFGLASLTYEGANGRLVIRPPGLSDSPGGVCGPAVFALYLGLVFAVVDKIWWKKLLAILFAILGAAAIFLTMVRSSLLIGLGMLVVYTLLQIVQGRPSRGGALLVVGLIAITAAFLHSAQSGGENMISRFHTIFEQRPTDFYSDNRGNQVMESFNELLPQHPFGAGLGRYGMMGTYFGNPQNRSAPPIWVEIQIPAWIVDGGVVLLVLYSIALIVAMKQQVRLAIRDPDGRVRLLAGIVLASNAGMIALCFSYAVFLAPVGMQFWFLSGALQGIEKKRQRKVATRTPERLQQHHSLELSVGG